MWRWLERCATVDCIHVTHFMYIINVLYIACIALTHGIDYLHDFILIMCFFGERILYLLGRKFLLLQCVNMCNSQIFVLQFGFVVFAIENQFQWIFKSMSLVCTINATCIQNQCQKCCINAKNVNQCHACKNQCQIWANQWQYLIQSMLL